jgi:hypothetical protein
LATSGVHESLDQAAEVRTSSPSPRCWGEFGSPALREILRGDVRVTLSKLESRSRHPWEQDRRREREARARGDEFRRYTYGDVFEAPELMLSELRSLLPPAR